MIGLGNSYRHDDAAGLAVAARMSPRVEQAVGTVVKRLVSELTVAGARGAG